jgi:hypothetical protein
MHFTRASAKGMPKSMPLNPLALLFCGRCFHLFDDTFVRKQLHPSEPAESTSGACMLKCQKNAKFLGLQE